MKHPIFLDALPLVEGPWQDALHWPTVFADDGQLLRKIPELLLDHISKQNDADLRAVLLLAIPSAMILPLVQFALWVDAAARKRMALEGHELLDALDAKGPCRPSLGRWVKALGVRNDPPVRHLTARRIARTASWTPVHLMPKAMTRPSGVALNHNGLLRSYLRKSGHAIRQSYDFDWDCIGAPPDEALSKKIDNCAMSGAVINEISAGLPLNRESLVRLQSVMSEFLEASIQRSVDCLSKLRQAKSLPNKLFSGTGNRFASRALGLEILRRGGEVIRFDHGGSTVLLDLPANIALSELSVSCKLMMSTKRAAETENVAEGNRRVLPIQKCIVEGHTGDPSLDIGSSSLRRSARPAGRRRVLYVSTALYALQQVVPPVMPAPLYLDWQKRLSDILNEFPIDFFRKPHPGGSKPPAGFELSGNDKYVAEPFEAVVKNIDVLVYDYAATTTLAQGLCTDRAIVLIDHGSMQFNSSVASQINSRCRIIDASYDDRGRPTINREEFEDAVCGSVEEADPSFFRKLFLDA